MKFKKANFDETQIQIVMKLKNSSCDKTKKNSYCDDTQKLKL